jgi:hypothetical protein
MCDPLAWQPLLLALVALLAFSRGLMEASGHAVTPSRCHAEAGHAVTPPVDHPVTPPVDHPVTPRRDGPSAADHPVEDGRARKRRLARDRQRRCRARRLSREVTQQADAVTEEPAKKAPLSLVPTPVVSIGKEVAVESARASPQQQSLMLPISGNGAEAKPAKGNTDDGQRGSWLPPDWQPDPEQLAFAAECGLDARETVERFRDYWIAVAGVKGRKRDWGATWRNWCRREARSDTKLGARPQRDDRRPGSFVTAIRAAAAAGPLRGSSRS